MCGGIHGRSPASKKRATASTIVLTANEWENRAVLLDKLLANISVHVDPVRDVPFNQWLAPGVAGPTGGPGPLRVERQRRAARSGRRSAHARKVLVGCRAKGVPHVLECGRRIQSSAVIDQAPPLGSGVTRLVAGSGGPVDFEVACGVITVSYGDSLNLFQRLQDVIVADLSGFPQVRVAFKSILAEQGGLNEGSGALTQALMSQCLVYLLRYLSQQPDSRSPG